MLQRSQLALNSMIKLTCIDLLLTNDTGKLSNTMAIDTGPWDFLGMMVAVLSGGFRKKGPLIVTNRNYRRFDNESFREKVAEELSGNSHL